MARGNHREPSPFRSGLLHAGLSLSVFGGVAAVIGAGVHLTGDASAAGPRQVIALFEASPEEEPGLAGRLQDEIQLAELEPELHEAAFEPDAIDEPTLDVSMPGDEAQYISVPSPVEPTVEGIRINGKFVQAGQSLSQVTEQAAAKTLAKAEPPKPISTEGLYQRTAGSKLPVISKDGRTVRAAYARPFSNPEGKPTVSLVIGGLGLKSNGRYTNAAIEELPPEITLSFVANAANLRTLVRRARAAGHEVIIEAPMEAYDAGRRNAHPRQLSTELSSDDNVSNLAWALSRADGYFAIMNYEGGKFASDASAVAPVMKELAARGVGLIESGNLPGSVFASAAADAKVHYAISGDVIDAQSDGIAIEERLRELERRAMKNGKALGTGFPYPITIDTVKAWAERLESKGILLAPASSVLSVPKVQPVTAATARAATSDGAR